MSDAKRVVVTGANKGIGLATVRAILRDEEDSFVFLGSRSEERGRSAREGLLDENPQWEERVEVLQLDVADDESVARAAREVSKRFEGEETPLYGVVNNAGIGLGSEGMKRVLEVNTRGPRRVCEAFLPLIDPQRGRIVNISSASGPNFVASCDEERRELLTNPEVTWEEIDALMREALEIDARGGSFQAAGLRSGAAYGLSKACLNAYTIALAREHPNLTINACTPGFIETDLTRPYAERQGVSPEDLGMKPPEKGTRAPLFLLFGDPGSNGWYFGSDAERSPLDRYRSPGDPPYRGE